MKRLVLAAMFALIGLVTILSSRSTSSELDAATLKQVVTEVATTIRDQYADPKVGEALADTIMARLEQGRFDAVTDEGTLVEQVMAVIRSKVADRHFELRVRGKEEDDAGKPSNRARSPHGLRKVEMLEHRTAYLEFDGLPGDDPSLQHVEKAIGELPEVSAIIFDIRDNNGGSGDMVVLLCSQLLEANTLLCTFSDRSGGDPVEVRAREAERDFGPAIPVFVLTSEATLSAAEAFAYILQSYGRATVVGERTAGMANPSSTFLVGNGFVLTVPFLIGRYGESGGTFAGLGIEPDTTVPADSALDVAVEEIEKLLDAGRPGTPRR